MNKNRTFDGDVVVGLLMVLTGGWLLLGTWPSYESVLLGGYSLGIGSVMFALKTREVMVRA